MFNLGYAVVIWLIGVLLVVKVAPWVIRYMDQTTEDSNTAAELAKRHKRREYTDGKIVYVCQPRGSK